MSSSARRLEGEANVEMMGRVGVDGPDEPPIPGGDLMLATERCGSIPEGGTPDMVFMSVQKGNGQMIWNGAVNESIRYLLQSNILIAS